MLSKIAKGYLSYVRWVMKYTCLAIVIMQLVTMSFGPDESRWLVVLILFPFLLLAIVFMLTSEWLRDKLK